MELPAGTVGFPLSFSRSSLGFCSLSKLTFAHLSLTFCSILVHVLLTFCPCFAHLSLTFCSPFAGESEAPALEAPPLPSTYGLTSGCFVVHPPAGDRMARPTLFIYAEADAHLFFQQFKDLIGAPLKMVQSYVLDVNKKVGGRVAHITVTPPPGRSVRPGGKTKTRRPNDRKLLTAAGTAALSRHHRSSKKGELWRGSKVFTLDYRCSATPLCDATEKHDCAARVLVTATVEQVHNGQVQIEVIGHNLAGASLHSSTIAWDPQLLQKSAETRSEAWRALHEGASKRLDDLKRDIIVQHREDERAGAAAGGGASESPFRSHTYPVGVLRNARAGCCSWPYRTGRASPTSPCLA